MKLSDYGMYNDHIRETWLEKVLLGLPKESTILDAGAGDQHHKKHCKHLKYISQDSGKYDGKGNSIGLHTQSYDYGTLDITSDIINIPREDESFDNILCSEVLEHVPYPAKVIRELSRLLKKNGTLILTAPFCSLTHFAPQHYSTGFNGYWYNKILPKEGLQVISMQPYGDYFQYLSQELHRLTQVASTYSKNFGLTDEEGKTLEDSINLLERLGQKGNKSWQLLCFGYMVVAKKIFNTPENNDGE